VEFYSDAKPLGEETPGFISTPAFRTTEGGGAVDIGAGSKAAFAGMGGESSADAGEDEGVDDHAETKLDQFWQFSDIENEVSFPSFKAWKDDYYQYYVNMVKRLSKEGKVPAEYAATIKDNLKAVMEFVKANFKSIQFFSVSPYLEEHPEYPEADGSAPLFAANMAYLIDGEEGAKFYFVKGAFNETKF